MTRLDRIRLDMKQVAKEIKLPLPKWHHNCHVVSHKIVNSSILPDLGAPVRRVARGWCRGVVGQHSWIVLGHDVYDRKAPIIDPTLWTYDPELDDIVYTTSRSRHRAHGSGSIFRAPMPISSGGEVVPLDPTAAADLSPRAHAFLSQLGPLDHHGWHALCHGGMEGWPASEIVLAMYRTEALRGLVPIDIVGMLTDENPGGCYLPVV